MYPLYKLRNGECHIGLPRKVTIPLVAYDVCINIALTALFIHILRPTLRFRMNMFQEARQPSEPTAILPCHLSYTADITTMNEKRPGLYADGPESNSSSFSAHAPQILGWRQPSNNTRQHSNKRIDVLLRKSLYGAILVLIPTLINMILLVIVRGTEQSWLCSTLCSLDGKCLDYHSTKLLLIYRASVTLQVCVVHWLTVDLLEIDSKPKLRKQISVPSSVIQGHGSVKDLQQV